MELKLIMNKNKSHVPFALYTLREFDYTVAEDKLNYVCIIPCVVKVTCNKLNNCFTIYGKRGDIISLYYSEISDYRIEV